MLNSDETIKTINLLVKKETPFLFIVDFEKENNIVIPLDQLSHHPVFFKTPQHNNIKSLASLPILSKFDKNPIPYSGYEVMFNKVVAEIKKGNSFLLNLTVPTSISTNLDLYRLFLISEARYKLYYNDEFVLFSPESFISIEDGVISTFPMKGTIRADIPNARQIIMNDEKEIAEHATIVDLLRNDLSIVASEVSVKNYRYTELIQTNFGPIYQVSSQIQGKLPMNYKDSLGEILFSLLPAGSVTGAPKNKTVSIIREIELCPRQYYTGIFGVWDTKKLDSAVMIRFIRKEDDRLWYHSGGGITFQSDCKLEYKEMIDKVYVPLY